ncbi:inactive hydroxysteroid dehydrogenase-like protein 1 [Neocloeon triangulifer]|uniref:inactive hydroxysteroid dehydrogenase-like protein 1 n=1 Tax=Neocloeon triangulifer TaxID=2078957 RepID=UPI00286F1CE5|nr:inactive hydroxysteroid dehydrogenase-like protein 1 [Neocloeon triangulifer]
MPGFWDTVFLVYEILAIYLVVRFLAALIFSLVATIYIHWLYKKLFQPVNLTSRYGKWAVVTGCTDGIGKNYAKELAARKLNLVLISRNAEKLGALAKEIESEFGVAIVKIVADFTGGQDIYKKIEDDIKDLDIGVLVNNVGITNPKPIYLEEMSAREMWDLVLVNVGASTAMTHLVLPGMKRRRRGIIVNISAFLERGPIPYFSLYAATKAYMKSFSDALRFECQGTGVEVQTLSPSFVNTQQSAAWGVTSDQEGLFVPSPSIFAKHAVATLGIAQNTSGYWPHELQYEFFKLGNDWVWMSGATKRFPTPSRVTITEVPADEPEKTEEQSEEKSHNE